MKFNYIFTLLLLFTALSMPISAQQQGAGSQVKTPNLLVQDTSRSDFWANGVLNLMYLDGTALSFSEALKVLDPVSGNQKLIPQVRLGRIAQWSLLGIMVASISLGEVARRENCSNYDEVIMPLTLTSAGLSLVGIAVLSPIGERKFMRAVDNYNLSIIGLPISGARP